MKRVILLMLFISTATVSAQISGVEKGSLAVQFGAGSRAFTDGPVKEIYSGSGDSYSIGLEYSLGKGCVTTLNYEKSTFNGELTYTHEETELSVSSVEAGFRYFPLYSKKTKFSPYLGVSIGRYAIKEINMIGMFEKNETGKSIEMGLRYFATSVCFLDIKGKYHHLDVSDESFPNSLPLEGFSIIAGVGICF